MRRTALPDQINREQREAFQAAIDNQGCVENWINDINVGRKTPPGLVFIPAEPRLLRRYAAKRPQVGDYVTKRQLKIPQD